MQDPKTRIKNRHLGTIRTTLWGHIFATKAHIGRAAITLGIGPHSS